MPSTRSPLNNLNAEIQRYYTLSTASSTKQTYSTGEKRFLTFCSLYKSQSATACLPADEQTLIEFSAYLAKSIKYSSIKNYLAAVRHLHIRNGFCLDVTKMLRLHLILRGIKRSQGDQKRVRLPITIHHLRIFRLMLGIPTTTNYDSIMHWAAMTLAFFGFLRLGELTCNTKYNSEVHLCPVDVTFSTASVMHIRLKQSKTDPFRCGQTITIGQTNSDLCPVAAMKHYLRIRKTAPEPGPLFVSMSAKPLTKDLLISETRRLLDLAGFNSSNFAGHSYRIGAATTAASVKLPQWLIKTLGRWSSDCYERYIQVPQSTLSNVAAALVKA